MQKLSIKLNKIKKLDRYAGQWVAFIDGKIVASEKDLDRLMKKVQKRYPKKEPSVLLVPRKDEGPYILIT